MLKLNTYSYPRLAFHVHQLMQHSAATDLQRTKAGEILWELFFLTTPERPQAALHGILRHGTGTFGIGKDLWHRGTSACDSPPAL